MASRLCPLPAATHQPRFTEEVLAMGSLITKGTSSSPKERVLLTMLLSLTRGKKPKPLYSFIMRDAASSVRDASFRISPSSYH